VNEAITTDDPTKIKEAVERLRTSSMEIGKSISQQSNQTANENTSGGDQ